MIPIYAAVAIALVVAGAIAGCLTVLAVVIHREERNYSLTHRSSGPATSGARSIHGVYTRSRSVLQQTSEHPPELLVLAGRDTKMR